MTQALILSCLWKPYPFYVFPVMVDENVITDFTVVLENGEWQVVDIGGRLSRIIYDKSNEKGINPTENHILRYAGATYVIINKDGKVTGYSPFGLGVYLVPAKDDEFFVVQGIGRSGPGGGAVTLVQFHTHGTGNGTLGNLHKGVQCFPQQ